MAVTITDNRTLIDHADGTGGWSSPVAGESITLFTSDPAPVEDSGCLGIAVSTETSEILHTHSAVDFSSGTGTPALVYVWILANGSMDTVANGGIQPLLGDGTNTIGFDLAGSDGAGFRHESGPVGWQCLLLDTANLPAGTTDARGTAGSLDDTAITEFGAQFKTLSKALGGASNCFIDSIRYGNGGLDILGGTSGDRGTFAEIATEDRDSTSGKAYGGLRELGSGLYGCQIALTFGETGTASHYFEDTNAVVNWESRGQSSGRFPVILQSNATGVGSFVLGVISGTENGTNGCSLIMPASSGNDFDASAAALDFCQLYDTTFKNFTGAVTFSDDATNGVNHDVFDCLFDTCGTVDPGRVDMKNTSFVNSSATSAMQIDDTDNTLLKNLAFISDGTGHAITLQLDGAGPHSITFTGFTYSGYAGTDGSTGNECVLVDSTSDADITLTITGGDVPTIMEAAGYTGDFTLVLASVTTLVVVRDHTNALYQNARVIIRASDGTGDLPYQDSVTITSVTTTATVAHTAHGLSTGKKVEIKGVDNGDDYNGVKTITVTGVNAYTYTVDAAVPDTATGTIISTGVVLEGLTDVNGEIEDVRPFSVDQPVEGVVRKGTSSPYYKDAPLSGIVDKDVGVTATVKLVLDE